MQTSTPIISNRPLFSAGRVVITPRACAEIMARYDEDATDVSRGFLIRHLGGDWQNLSEHDQQVNQIAAQQGARVLSSFPLAAFESEKEIGQEAQRIWIITEADRSRTTILLPEEY